MQGHASSNLAKHQTGNPVVRRLLDRYFRTLLGLVDSLRPQRILDVGCGEGVTAGRLGALPFGFDYLGIDMDAGAVAYAKSALPERQFRVGSVFDLGAEKADLVVCLEVLEHLTDPDAAIACLRAATTRDCIVSVPWEPWFRLGNLARGKYLSRLGNHPEHLQAFSPTGIAERVAQKFGPCTVHTAFPWVFVHARVAR